MHKDGGMQRDIERYTEMSREGGEDQGKVGGEFAAPWESRAV